METSSIKPKKVAFGLGSPGVNAINKLIDHDVADLKYVAIDSYAETRNLKNRYNLLTK